MDCGVYNVPLMQNGTVYWKHTIGVGVASVVQLAAVSTITSQQEGGESSHQVQQLRESLVISTPSSLVSGDLVAFTSFNVNQPDGDLIFKSS